MKLKFKLLSLFMILVLAVGAFAACAKKDADSDSTENTENTENNGNANESKDPYKKMHALDFTKAMGNGINLGNTMEAYGHDSYGTDAATSVYETSWGMPVTTAEMIQGMKDAGFDSIRVPVAWTNMMAYEDGDYTINRDYLERVGEIIDYAIAADMIVVVNDHWDGGWWGMFGSPDEATREKAMTLYTEMWTQIAEAYKNYDSRLVFESANEELGDKLNEAIDNVNGTLTEDECYEVTNKINQKFVDTVRAAGGNNKDRFLLIAGYNTDITRTCDERYKMPTDTIDDKLILSVHYYDPSGYCIFSSAANWGTKAEVEAMNEGLKKLTKFTDAGYGVIIGEWGVLDESGKNNMASNTLDYYKNFIANCDLYGYCPMLWDTSFMYDRSKCAMRYEEVGEFFLKQSYSKKQASLPDEDIIGMANRAMKQVLDAAPEGALVPDTEARAWIMYTSSDWSVQYKVGDDYPDSMTAGVVATEATITGPGTYTVKLDLTGTGAGKGVGMTFSAVGILNGETLFPDHYIDIKEIRINGTAIEMTGEEYTTCDAGTCTRANIYNSWVSAVPDGARTPDGDLTGCTPTPVDATKLGDIQTIEVDFEFIAP